MYIVEPRSPFDAIKKVEAGSILEVNTKTLYKKINFYWSIDRIKNKNKKTDIYKILSKIKESSSYVATSDVNIALANSGGADSGIIYNNLIKNNNKFSQSLLKIEIKNIELKVPMKK